MGHGKMRVIVELAIPFAAVGLLAGRRGRISVRGMRGDVEVDRSPSQGWWSVEVPEESFDRVRWEV